MAPNAENIITATLLRYMAKLIRIPNNNSIQTEMNRKPPKTVKSHLVCIANTVNAITVTAVKIIAVFTCSSIKNSKNFFFIKIKNKNNQMKSMITKSFG